MLIGWWVIGWVVRCVGVGVLFIFLSVCLSDTMIVRYKVCGIKN